MSSISSRAVRRTAATTIRTRRTNATSFARDWAKQHLLRRHPHHLPQPDWGQHMLQIHSFCHRQTNAALLAQPATMAELASSLLHMSNLSPSRRKSQPYTPTTTWSRHGHGVHLGPTNFIRRTGKICPRHRIGGQLLSRHQRSQARPSHRRRKSQSSEII